MGLMGGTFDPLHMGHLFIAEAARVQCGLDKVVFFPNRIPAHVQGKSAQASPDSRWKITLAGIEGNVRFEASRVELDREGPSYAYDTLQYFAGEFAELFFIIGSDSLADLLIWNRGAELFEMCHFIAAPRPGYDSQEALMTLNEKQRAKVLLLEMPELALSSVDIRNRVRRDLPIRYLVPDAVERIIRQLHLYQE
ncbi:MAG: nicotinate-nucleotide adenylyltransferase [Abditibacteriaceae bacterium]